MPDTEKIDISIAILTLNSSETLPATLESVGNTIAFSNDLVLEIIVIDGGSSDDTIAIVKNYFPDANIIQDRSRNLAIARNIAIRTSRGKYIAFIDSDITISKDFFEKLMPLFNDSTVAGVSAFPSMSGQDIISEYYSTLKNKRTTGITVEETAGTTSIIFRKKYIDFEIDPFYSRRCEDTYLTGKLTRKGYRLLMDWSVHCLHTRPASLLDEVKRHYYFGKFRAVCYPEIGMKIQLRKGMIYLLSIPLAPLIWLFRLRAHNRKKLKYGFTGWLLLYSRRLGELSGSLQWHNEIRSREGN